jgi:hypothetical protein
MFDCLGVWKFLFVPSAEMPGVTASKGCKKVAKLVRSFCYRLP